MLSAKVSFEKLLEAIQANIANNFALYDMAFQLASSPETLQSRVIQLFRRQDDASEVAWTPYQKITDATQFGAADGAHGTIAWRKREAQGGFGEAFQNSLEIKLTDSAESGWFSLEFDAPFSEVRRADAVSLLAIAQFEFSFRMRIELFAWDQNGDRHWFGQHDLNILDGAPSYQTTFPIVMPEHVAFDEQREPRVAIFLEPREQTIILDSLWLRLI